MALVLFQLMNSGLVMWMNKHGLKVLNLGHIYILFLKEVLFNTRPNNKQVQTDKTKQTNKTKQQTRPNNKQVQTTNKTKQQTSPNNKQVQRDTFINQPWMFRQASLFSLLNPLSA